MIESASRRLRELVDSHVEARIDWETYRVERGRLLDELAEQGTQQGDDEITNVAPVRVRSPADGQPRAQAPSAPVSARAPVEAPPVRTVASSPTAAAFERGRRSDQAPPRPADSLAPVAKNRRLPLALAGAGMIVAALVLWMALPRPADDVTVPAAVDQMIAQPAPAPAASEPQGEALLRQFMAADNWTELLVSSFLLDWDRLSELERQELRQSETFRQFVSEVRKRVLVDRAVGAPAVRDGLSLSEALAAELDLGLNIQRDPGRPAQPDAGTAAEVEPDPKAPSEVNASVENPAAPAPDATDVSAEVAVESTPVALREGALPSEASTAPVAAGVGETASSAAAAPASEQPCSADRLNLRSTTCWDMLDPQTRGPLLRVIPAGEFVMGDRSESTASPAAPRVVAAPLAIGMFEVSYSEFARFCEAVARECPASRWGSPDHPIVNVSWFDAQAYVAWLSEKTGARYRLPTEMEWEYATRGGTTTRYPFGEVIGAADARYDAGIQGLTPLPVSDRTTKANGFRLMHMVGNVREWTADTWRDHYSAAEISDRAVVRGGSYADPPAELRSAARRGLPRNHRDDATGIRVVRDL